MKNFFEWMNGSSSEKSFYSEQEIDNDIYNPKFIPLSQIRSGNVQNQQQPQRAVRPTQSTVQQKQVQQRQPVQQQRMPQQQGQQQGQMQQQPVMPQQQQPQANQQQQPKSPQAGGQNIMNNVKTALDKWEKYQNLSNDEKNAVYNYAKSKGISVNLNDENADLFDLFSSFYGEMGGKR